MRVALHEDERFPTLSADDGQWRDPPGFYEDEAVVDVPEHLLHELEAARTRLREVEDEIRRLRDA